MSSNMPWDIEDVAKATGISIFISIAIGLSIINFSGGGVTSFIGKKFLGIPTGIIFISSQQIIFLLLAWRFSISKYEVGLRDLGFRAVTGNFSYLKTLTGWGFVLIAIALWGSLIRYLNWDILELNNNVGLLLDLSGGLMQSLIVAGICGPICEEIFFRGFVFAGLLRRFNKAGATIGSAGLFALFHVDPATYIPVFIFGIVLAWLYQQTRSIWPCIVVHGLHNLTAISIAAI